MGFLALIEFKCPVTGILYSEKTNFPLYVLLQYGILEKHIDDPRGLEACILDLVIFPVPKKKRCPPILPLPPLPLP